MLASHLDGVPGTIDEAARVDDTTALDALFRRVLLAARPGVVALEAYSFMTSGVRSSSWGR